MSMLENILSALNADRDVTNSSLYFTGMYHEYTNSVSVIIEKKPARLPR